MKLLVEFDCCVQILDVPQQVVENRKKLSNQFLDWIYDKSNDHEYWELSSDGKKLALSYDAEAFAAWLNAFVLNQDAHKAVFIGDCSFDEIPKDIPSICF